MCNVRIEESRVTSVNRLEIREKRLRWLEYVYRSNLYATIQGVKSRKSSTQIRKGREDLKDLNETIRTILDITI